MTGGLLASRSRALACAASVIGAISLGAACASEEIVLATLPPSDDAGVAPELMRCMHSSECSASAFCAHKACGDPAGLCEARPIVCEEAAMPVCGCNGVTYWNDCLRRAAGISAMTPGECAVGARWCRLGPAPGPGGPGGPGPEPSDGCPAGSLCARLLPPDLEGTTPPTPDACPDVPGTCWAIPAVCPERGGPDRWIPCGLAGAACTSTCAAIRSGVPHKRATACL